MTFNHEGEHNLERREERLLGLDLFRVASAFLIFLFHTGHIDCSYGIFDGFIRMGAVAMTGFFMLSGYSLYYNYSQQDLHDVKNVGRFYIKRGIGILPDYYVVALLYILFLGSESIFENILLFPTEVFGIQSVFSSLFNVTHNSGTWFISCIILCYLVFPFISEMLK